MSVEKEALGAGSLGIPDMFCRQWIGHTWAECGPALAGSKTAPAAEVSRALFLAGAGGRGFDFRPPHFLLMSILEDFLRNKCSVCGSTKRPRQSFCYRCFKALPERLQRALYRRFGEGYELAFTEAQQRLRQEKA